MALVVRYFSTTGAGAADGTTWADRAALFSAGNWSTVITGHDFSADTLLAAIGPGTYACSQSLTTAVITTDPIVAHPLILHGCDSSGVLLAPPDPDWVSAQAPFSDSTLPLIETTTNITTVNLANCFVRLMKFTASGRNGVAMQPASMAWCVVTNSTANTSAGAMGTGTVFDSVLSCTGSSYSAVAAPTNNHNYHNVRIIGVAGSSGNRDGIVFAGTTARTVFSRVTAVGMGGRPWAYTGTNAAVNVEIVSCVFAGATGDLIQFPNTASQTTVSWIQRCMLTGGGAFGINPGGTNTNLLIAGNRLRDNTSGNFGTTGDYPTTTTNYTTDSDDATEYVNAGSGDYRIKYGSAIWGQGYGAGDEPAPSGSGGGRRPRLTRGV